MGGIVSLTPQGRGGPVTERPVLPRAPDPRRVLQAPRPAASAELPPASSPRPQVLFAPGQPAGASAAQSTVSSPSRQRFSRSGAGESALSLRPTPIQRWPRPDRTRAARTRPTPGPCRAGRRGTGSPGTLRWISALGSRSANIGRAAQGRQPAGEGQRARTGRGPAPAQTATPAGLASRCLRSAGRPGPAAGQAAARPPRPRLVVLPQHVEGAQHGAAPRPPAARSRRAGTSAPAAPAKRLRRRATRLRVDLHADHPDVRPRRASRRCQLHRRHRARAVAQVHGDRGGAARRSTCALRPRSQRSTRRSRFGAVSRVTVPTGRVLATADYFASRCTLYAAACATGRTTSRSTSTCGGRVTARSDFLAQPAQAGAEDTRRHRPALERQAPAGSHGPASSGSAPPGRAHSAPALPRAVPARTERRAASASRDRQGHRSRAAADRRRRTALGPGRVRQGQILDLLRR